MKVILLITQKLFNNKNVIDEKRLESNFIFESIIKKLYFDYLCFPTK